MRAAVCALVAPLLLLGAVDVRAHKAYDEHVATPATPEQAADAVVAAWRSGSHAALERLASLDQPDPWIVADELCARGRHDAAGVFAEAAPRFAVQDLPAYVSSRRGGDPDVEVRNALEAASRASERKDWRAVLDSTEGVEVTADTVSGLRILGLRAVGLKGLRRPADSARAYSRAAVAATSLGWHAHAASGYLQAGIAAYPSDVRAALASWTTAVELFERLGDRAAAARSHGLLGSAHDILGDHREAIAQHDLALRAFAALDDRRGMAVAVGSMGIVFGQLRRNQEALECALAAVDLFELAGDRRGMARAIGNAGRMYARLEDDDHALSFYVRSIAVLEALGDHAGASNVLLNRGMLHRRRGDLLEALACYERSMEMSKAAGNRTRTAALHNNIGNIHIFLGAYRKALTIFRRGLALHRALGDRFGYAETTMNMGAAYQYLCEYPKALEAQMQALEMFEALDNAQGVARVLGNIGNLHQLLGEYPKALNSYRKALASFEALQDRESVATTHMNIGGVFKRMRRYEDALTALGRALEMFEALGERYRVALTVRHIAIVHRAQGDFERAERIQKRALALSEAVGDRAEIAACHYDLGTLRARVGDFSGALELYERSLELLRDLDMPRYCIHAHRGAAIAHLELGAHEAAMGSARAAVELLSRLHSGLGEQEGASARERWTAAYEVGALAALRHGSEEDFTFFLESGRAEGLREALDARQALSEALVPAELRNAAAAARAREARASARLEQVRAGGHLRAIREARIALAQARDHLEAVTQRIQRTAKAGADVAYPKAASLQAIRSRLDPGEALLLLGSCGENAVAQVVRAEATSAHELCALERIDALVDALDLDQADGSSEETLQELRREIVEPLGLGEDTTCVLVSPFGRLSYVPFTLLLPDHEVAYVSSGTTYVLLTDQYADRGRGVLALGDPVYGEAIDEAAVATIRGGRSLRRLPATREEARAVGDVVLLGPEATEARLLDTVQERERWRAVHLACHGLIDVERPMFSSLALTPEGTSSGLLTSLEVFHLRFPADLVVLSACETARGRLYKAEGIVGLTRAFMFAGSPRVICSLWKVDDEATKALIVEFYRLWNPRDGSQGLGAAAALREAQRFVRAQKRWAHPYYWAAWVLWGLPDRVSR